MARKRTQEAREITLVAKASHWLADALLHSIRMETELATIDPQPRREEIRSRSFHRLIDAQQRLALALEAYGEAIRGGDEERVVAAIDELEVGYGENRRPAARRTYEDPIHARETTRHLRRDLQSKRTRLDELRSNGGASKRELRELEQEIQALESVLN